MFRKIITALIIFIGVHSARADLGWHLIYENDASGNAVSGSVAALIGAIDSGADIKVLVSVNGVESTAVPSYIGITANRQVVYAHYRELSLDERADESVLIKSPTYDIDIVVNSTGFVSVARFYKNGTKVAESTYSWPIKWFVNN